MTNLQERAHSPVSSKCTEFKEPLKATCQVNYNRHFLEYKKMFSMQSQSMESELIREVLLCLQGVNGKYYCFDFKSETFFIPSTKASLLSPYILACMLNFTDLASYLMKISLFINKYLYSGFTTGNMVIRKFCTSIDEVKGTYLTQLSALMDDLKHPDSQFMSLLSVWNKVRTFEASLRSIAAFLGELSTSSREQSFIEMLFTKLVQSIVCYFLSSLIGSFWRF